MYVQNWTCIDSVVLENGIFHFYVNAEFLMGEYVGAQHYKYHEGILLNHWVCEIHDKFRTN